MAGTWPERGRGIAGLVVAQEVQPNDNGSTTETTEQQRNNNGTETEKKQIIHKRVREVVLRTLAPLLDA